MKSPRRNASGLSLVELLMAAVVVASAGSLLAGGLVISNRGADRRLAQLLATQILATELALLEDQVVGAFGEDSGRRSPPPEPFRVTRRWEPVADQMAQMTLTVSDGSYTAYAVTYRPVKEP
ncbi:MAG: hypothetical protein Q8R78_07075 [Candidatus Omnitrophota bacterium]|nr:hypothetical protein [Candidatus Omnitrophota bacterium]